MGQPSKGSKLRDRVREILDILVDALDGLLQPQPTPVPIPVRVPPRPRVPVKR